MKNEGLIRFGWAAGSVCIAIVLLSIPYIRQTQELKLLKAECDQLRDEMSGWKAEIDGLKLQLDEAQREAGTAAPPPPPVYHETEKVSPPPPSKSEVAGSTSASKEPPMPSTTGAIIKFGNPAQEAQLSRIDWQGWMRFVLAAASNRDADTGQSALNDSIPVLEQVAAIRGYPCTKEQLENDPVLSAYCLNALLNALGAGLDGKQMQELEKICAAADVFTGDAAPDYAVANRCLYETKMKAILTDEQKRALKESNIAFFIGFE